MDTRGRSLHTATSLTYNAEHALFDLSRYDHCHTRCLTNTPIPHSSRRVAPNCPQEMFSRRRCATATAFGTPRCLSGNFASVIVVCDPSRLILERIPSSVYYFSSESVIAHIRTMAQLRTISTNFLSATPRLGLTNGLFLPPCQTSQARIELPDLKRLVYRGVSTYIESLLARIRAPLIQDIDITFFNQLTFRIPRICTFISGPESFRPTTARIDFAQTSARMLSITPSASLQSNESQSQSPDISLSVSCARLDFQVSAMSRICSGLSGTSSISGTGPAHANLVLPVEELILGFHQSELRKSGVVKATMSSTLPYGTLS